MHPRFSLGKISDDARRVRFCAIGADSQTANLAHEAVSDVEMHLLQSGWPVGEALGAIPDIQKILGLGRPACREAIIILEARGLLEVRRSRKGGLFVAAPTAEDVVGAMLMYLAISGVRTECVHEFRVLVWRMVVETAIKRRVAGEPFGEVGEWGFAFDLAQRIGNPAMVLASQIAEMLVLTCAGRPAPVRDALLETAIKARDLSPALSRLEVLAGGPVALTEPVLALEMIEHRLVWSERRGAVSLAAKMTREMIHNPDTVEAEWETADRFGYPDLVVRQARRILQDFGIVRCRRGSRGVLWRPAAGPAGVIRMLTPCLMASGMTASDNTEAFYFLAGQRSASGCRTDGPTQPDSGDRILYEQPGSHRPAPHGKPSVGRRPGGKECRKGRVPKGRGVSVSRRPFPKKAQGRPCAVTAGS